MITQRTLTPIFVAGIGRSGTSAVLKSLIHHPAVFKPEILGEAPLIARFTEFLKEYEDHSPNRDYHLKNYKLDKKVVNKLYNNLMFHISNGVPVEQVDAAARYWIAKLSFPESLYSKYEEIYSGFKIIYVMRNGVEVVNSASKFHGFADLSFEQLCHRWANSFESNDYLLEKTNCAVIKHHELVSAPDIVYCKVFDKLEIEPHNGPASFIQTNLFNSSFSETSSVSKIKRHFDDRLQCWNDWTEEQRSTFISICDKYMGKHGFEKPYANPAVDIRSSSNLEGDENSAASAIIKQLEMNMPHEQVIYSTHASENQRYLYTETPKVACTSIKRSLQIAEYQSRHEEVPAIVNPHKRDTSPLLTLDTFSAEELDKLLFSDDYYRFCFVRNPFTRLASGYMSKISRNLPAKRQILSIIKGVSAKEIEDLSEFVSFEEFVEVLASQSEYHMNPHWRPQYSQLFFEHINYHFIGKFERLSEDLSLVSQRFQDNAGIELTLPKAKNKTNSSSMLDSLYTPAIVKKVISIYEKDFEQFEYSYNFENLLAKAAS
ncbi:MAG: sulfotransferase family 2 domain-containing protein [Gammaproteobacteria bacterium]|nr:sulfotransferase family 2 domain-containing protein [Gammaproteobacteria bacterium]